MAGTCSAEVLVNGKSVSLPGGNLNLAAIDTGTSYIGAPTDAVKAIWGAVPGSQALTGDQAGFFAFRTYFSSSSFPSACVLRHGHGVGIVVYRVRLTTLPYQIIQRVTLSFPLRYPSEARHGRSVSLT